MPTAALSTEDQTCAVIDPYALAAPVAGQRIPWNERRETRRILNGRCTRIRPIILATLALASSPVLAVDFPLHANDLNAGERVFTKVHGPGGGEQTGAKDLEIVRRVADNNWSFLKAGKTDNTVNSNWLIYGRPVYAMAGGTVIGCWRNAPQNKAKSGNLPEVGSKKILLQGNHLWIQQADGNIALYAHAITGDIPASLCPNNGVYLPTGTALNTPKPTQPGAAVTGGATVTAGQLLFHAGNSGNSSQPHVHVHMVNASNSWQPMNFDRGQTTPFGSNIASLNGPWTPLKGAALPTAQILIWPPHPIGNWTYNGIDAPAFQRVFDHFVDSGVMADTITCKNNGATYDTTWVPTQGSWSAKAGMTATDFFQKNAALGAQGFTLASSFVCGTKVAAVWRKA